MSDSTHTDALHEMLDADGAEWMPYGSEEQHVSMPASFDVYEAEYAAIRQRVAVMHWPQRGLLRFTGEDVKDYLNRMLTQDIAKATGGTTVRSFLLTDKGRVLADMLVHHGDMDTWLEMDVFDIPAVQKLLEDRLFAEDVTIENISDQRRLISLYGPAALPALEAVADEKLPDVLQRQSPASHAVVPLADGVPASCFRFDIGSVYALHAWVPTEAAADVWRRLVNAVGYDPQAEKDAEFAEQRRQGLRGRPVGWLAFNTARIEEGRPMFHIDFGTDSLPGETGVLDEACSFTKGCYIGQEVVARMKNLGHPKQIVVKLQFEADTLPVAGEQVLADREGKQVGVVSSSTVSPLAGGKALALAVVKWGRHESGGKLIVPAEGKMVEATVQPL